MPIIEIEFDDAVVNKEDILSLSHSIQKIVSKATGIKDVFVYANSAQIKVHIAPIEIFVKMSAHILKNEEKMMKEIKSELSQWKKNTHFSHPVNLTLIPMKWKIEIGI